MATKHKKTEQHTTNTTQTQKNITKRNRNTTKQQQQEQLKITKICAKQTQNIKMNNS